MATVHDARVIITREQVEEEARNEFNGLDRPLTDDEWDRLRFKIEAAMEDVISDEIEFFVRDIRRTDIRTL